MQDLTQGPVGGHVFRFALFMFATMLFQTLYFLVDLYFVGATGSAAVAAVSVAGNLMFLVMAATQALAVGTTTLVSHAVGAKDRAGAERTFNQSQSLALLCALVFGVGAFLLRESYAVAFTADAATARLAVEYLNWFVPALALQFAMVAMAAALRGAGDIKLTSLVQVGSLLLNIALAPVLIAGWLTGKPMGAAGAGLATFISVAVGTVLLARLFLRPEIGLRLQPRTWRPDFAVWKRLLGIGLPAGGEFALMAVFMGVIYAILSDVGMQAQAGFGVGMRVMQAIFLPALAVSFALAPIAGQNIGAGLHERVRETFRVGLTYVVTLMLLFTALCQLAPAAMIGFFSNDAAAIAVGVEFITIVSLNFVANGVIFSCAGLFQAFGNTLPSLFASSLRIVLFAIPALVVSSQPWFELRHLWYLSVASVTIQMTIAFVLLLREFRRRMPLIPATAPA